MLNLPFVCSQEHTNHKHLGMFMITFYSVINVLRPAPQLRTLRLRCSLRCLLLANQSLASGDSLSSQHSSEILFAQRHKTTWHIARPQKAHNDNVTNTVYRIWISDFWNILLKLHLTRTIIRTFVSLSSLRTGPHCVEPRGLEPLTSSLQRRRSPS
jgi:hypothetical protein